MSKHSGHIFYYKKNSDLRSTNEFKKKHRKEIEELLIEYLKNNSIRRVSIDWDRFKNGNKKRRYF